MARIRAVLLIAVVMALVGAAAGRADACSLFTITPVGIDPAYATDATAPTLAVAGWDVYRGEGTCAGTGLIEVATVRSDDRVESVRLGHEVTIRSGAWPRGAAIPTGPFTQLLGDQFSLPFADDGQAIDVELEIRAVDLNGNRSAPVSVRITDAAAAADDGGCAVGRPGPSPLGLVLPLLVAVAARRRRRR